MLPIWIVEIAVLGFGLVACNPEPRIIVGRLHNPSTKDGGDSTGGATGHTDADSIAPSAPSEDATTGSTGIAADAATPPGECELETALHSYAFDGVGSAIADQSGNSDGTARGGAALTGSGTLQLDGNDDYVHLPTGILNTLSSVSVIVWLTYDGGPAYVRIFDLGSSSAGVDPPEGTASVGRSYFALSPETGFDPPGLAATLSEDGPGGEIAVASDRNVDDGLLHQVVVVFDGESQSLLLYLDGALLGSQVSPFPLSVIEDTNNWLGRSQYDADPYWEGSYEDVQIFGTALSACQIAASFARGI